MRHPKVRPVLVSVLWGAAIFYFAFCALVLFTRYFLLPRVDDYRDDIAAAIGKALACEVTIGEVRPRLDSFWPHLSLKDVMLRREDSRATDDNILKLPVVEASFFWRSFLGEPIFRYLQVPDAEFTVRRVSPDAFDIAGIFIDFSKSTGDSSTSVINWLLKQKRIDFTGATVRYLDLIAEPEPRTTVYQKIDFSFESGVQKYRAGIQGEMQAAKPNHVDLRVEFTTPFFDGGNWKSWEGSGYLAVDDFNIARATSPVLPARRVLLRGHGSTKAHFSFAGGRVTSFTTQLHLADVLTRLSADKHPLEVPEISMRLSEKLENGIFEVRGENMSFALSDGTLVKDLAISASVPSAMETEENKKVTDTSRFTINSIDLQILRKLLPSMPLPEPVAKQIERHSARGMLSDMQIVWHGNPAQLLSWTVSGNFEGISIEPQNSDSDYHLAVENLSGHVEVTDKGGSVVFATEKGAVVLPEVFETARVPLDRLEGTLRWALPDGETPLKLTFDNIAAANGDAAVHTSGTWTAAGGKAGTIDLSGTITDVNASSVWKYIPLIVGQNVRDWLRAGLVRGRGSNGEFVLKGDLVHFPWKENNPEVGRFYVSADVAGAAIDYVPSYVADGRGGFVPGEWPLLEKISGRITFEGGRMLVEASSAQTRSAHIDKATAEIPDLSAGHDVMLLIHGQTRESLQKMFDYVNTSPVTGFVSDAFKETTATGFAGLDLKLSIPLAHASDTGVEGAVKLSGNSVTMAYPRPPLTDVEGTVNFFERGATARNVHARAFGSGDVTVSVDTSSEGTIIISATGRTDVSNLGWFASNPYFSHVVKSLSGEMPFVSSVLIDRKTGVTVSARSTMQGVFCSLPAPLKKAANKEWPLVFGFAPTGSGKTKGYRISASAAGNFDFVMQMPSEDSQMPYAGSVAVGKRARLPSSGFDVAVDVSDISLRDWAPFIIAMRNESKKQNSSGEAGASLNSISLSAKRVQSATDTLNDVTFKATADTKGDWDVAADSDRISGKLRLEWSGRGLITGQFDRLHLSENSSDFARRFLEGEPDEVGLVRPTVLPDVDITSESFSYGKMRFGKLLLQAQSSGSQVDEKFTISNFALLSDAGAVSATGEWSQGTRVKTGSSKFDVTVTARDLGQMLTNLGYGGVISGSTGTLTARIAYDGKPWDPDLKTLTGSASIDFRRGSFSKIDTGAGGVMLSLLSFQSLMKRLTLDFSDFTEEGMSFDAFTGTGIIADGISHTDNTKISGTHGTILLSGLVNFPDKNVDAHAIVLPDINAGNASLALTFVNPAVGIGTFLAQLLLRTPLSQLFKVEYDIKGPWENPTVTKTGANEPAKKTEAAPQAP